MLQHSLLSQLDNECSFGDFQVHKTWEEEYIWREIMQNSCFQQGQSVYSVTFNVLKKVWFLKETKELLKSNKNWGFLLSWCRTGLQLLSRISLAGQSAVFTKNQSREPFKNPPLPYFCSLLCGFFFLLAVKREDIWLSADKHSNTYL